MWRRVFDAVERPVTSTAEGWVQSDAFMDRFALAWRVQRRVDREVKRGLDAWVGAWRLSSRRDVDRLSNQVARLEREIRRLERDRPQRAELEAD